MKQRPKRAKTERGKQSAGLGSCQENGSQECSVSVSRFRINRAAARILVRLRVETALASIGSICFEEWKECRDILADEIAALIQRMEKQ